MSSPLINIHLKACARAASTSAVASASASAASPAELTDEIAQLKAQLAQKEALLSRAGGASAKKSKKKGSTMIDTDPVQGCRDFPPEEMRIRNKIFGVYHKVGRMFGFEEYDAPMLEAEELYIRKGGEEITEQMFNFVTKGGHRVALRPEMTPTLARLILKKGSGLMLPQKWYSIPQCWRYEAIVRGRKREHYQWNMDIVGVKGITAEVEVVSAVITALEEFGLTSKDVGIKINSRKILQTVVEKAGCPADKFAAVCVIVDKIEKLPAEEIEAMLVALELQPSVIETITSTLRCRSIEEVAARVGADHEAIKEITTFFDLMDSYGLKDWLIFDASVVRGLAYYTGLVFEAFDREGNFRAIAGGGRYDGLLQTYGAKQGQPCCGFGFGDCVIVELLQSKGLLGPIPQQLDDVVIPFDESMRPGAMKVLRRLRQSGRTVDIILTKKRVGDAYNYADRVNSKRAVLVAPSEWAEGCVKVKDLRLGKDADAEKKEVVMKLDELVPPVAASAVKPE